MIVDKAPLPDDPTPSDAPPSYQTLGLYPSYHDPKDRSQTSVETPDSSAFASSSTSVTHIIRAPSNKRSVHTGSKPRSAWFSFGVSRTTQQVRSTVLGLVRDLVREQDSEATHPLAILQSCADACSNHGLSVSKLLQEKSVEGHTPLYWAIVKRPPEEGTSTRTSQSLQTPDLLTALLGYSTPLNPETISEIRLACLLTSDQPLFHRLRLSPEFSPMSGTDQMLLGGTIPPDDIRVEDVVGDEGAFVVHFEIVQFQKRMHVSKQIELEFIARARMWRLQFAITTDSNSSGSRRPGSWCISLALLENSPPTWIDSRLIIPEPIPAPAPSSLPPSSLFSSPNPTTPYDPTQTPLPPSPPSPAAGLLSGFAALTGNSGPTTPKPRPTISLRLKSDRQLTAPLPSGRRNFNGDTEIVVALEDSLMGASLQYAGSSYIASDEVLRGRLEARLAKPDTECIIC